MDNRPIGIMDSGVGGLTVACVLKEKYPNEKFIFIKLIIKRQTHIKQ